jgi:hypothetical protein
VKGDDIGLRSRQSPQSTIAKGDVPMGRSVESVAPNAVAPIEMMRDGIQVSLLGNGMMERRIENCYLGDGFTKEFARRHDAFNIVGIVEGREIDAVFDSLYHLIVNDSRFLETPCTTRCPTACTSAVLLISRTPDRSDDM